MGYSIRPSATGLALRGNGRECLALREKATTKQGDAFLARAHMPDVVLPMVDGSYRTCTLGMRLPYGQ
jgi:hypothetical protein